VRPLKVLTVVCQKCGHRQIAYVERLGDDYTMRRNKARRSRQFEWSREEEMYGPDGWNESWAKEDGFGNRDRRIDLVKAAKHGHLEPFRREGWRFRIVVACPRHGERPRIDPYDLLVAAKKAAVSKGPNIYPC
jgi:hypothetical protein